MICFIRAGKVVFCYCVWPLQWCMHTQLCLTLCDPIDCNPPLSLSFQARILEWVAVSYSRGYSSPKNQTRISGISWIGRWILYHWCHLGTLASPMPQPRYGHVWSSREWQVNWIKVVGSTAEENSLYIEIWMVSICQMFLKKKKKKNPRLIS